MCLALTNLIVELSGSVTSYSDKPTNIIHTNYVFKMPFLSRGSFFAQEVYISPPTPTRTTKFSTHFQSYSYLFSVYCKAYRWVYECVSNSTLFLLYNTLTTKTYLEVCFSSPSSKERGFQNKKYSMTTSDGKHRYYLQVGDTNCTLVINETDYDEPIEIDGKSSAGEPRHEQVSIEYPQS